MNKKQFIEKAQKDFNVTVRYSGNNNTMYFTGDRAKEAKKEMSNLGFEVEVGYQKRVLRVEADAIAD